MCRYRLVLTENDQYADSDTFVVLFDPPISSENRLKCYMYTSAHDHIYMGHACRLHNIKH